MSYQNPQISTQNIPPIPLGSRQPMSNNLPNGSTGLKQQYLPPTFHTNGLDNPRIVNQSLAINQSLNSAYLPQTTSTSIQQPNMYTTSNVSATAAPSPLQLQSQVQSNQQIPSSQPITTTSASNMNYYQSIAKPATLASQQQPSPPTHNPSTFTPNTLNFDRITSNLQNININTLNNGNGVISTQHPVYNQTAGSHSPQAMTNRLTNGNSANSTQMQPSPTIPGPMPAKSVALSNVVPPLLQQSVHGLQKGSNQVASDGLQQQQPQQQFMPLQFNGTSSTPGVPNKFPPPMIQQQQQYPQHQCQQAVQFVSNASISNSTIGKRPLYPAQPPPPPSALHQQQQQLHQQQQQSPQQHQINTSTTNKPTMPYNQYQTPPMPTQSIQSPTGAQPAVYQNNVVQRGFDSMWGHNTIDLMQHRHILPPIPVEPPKISLEHQFYESVNCSPE